MFGQVRVFLEMIKFGHTIFALPFALLAASLASERVGGWRIGDLVGVLLCMIFARSAAMGFNRWADHQLDALNPRTKGRAIPAGRLSPGEVLLFVIVCSLGFIASTGIFWFVSENLLPLFLSVPVLSFLFAYSYCKRFTLLSHLWLGTALALSPMAAWIAISAELALSPVLLGLAVVCWVTGFDVIYACQDIDSDRKLDLKSIPARLGFDGAMHVARAMHVLMIVALLALGWLTDELTTFYWLGLTAACGLLTIEHWLVRNRDLLRINVAFFHVNGIISIGLLLVTWADLYFAEG